MISKRNIATLVVAFLVFSFLLLALPEKGISSILDGCCRTVEESDPDIPSGECVGCVSGCATSVESNFCTEEGGFAIEGVCINIGGGALCVDVEDDDIGCCVVGELDCEEGVMWRNCVGDAGPFTGELWFPNEDGSCSEVPQCVPPPTTAPPTTAPPTTAPPTTAPPTTAPPTGTPQPISAIPTISQWGLIVTAVMLGLFSLITVRRGFKVNNK